MKYLISDCIEFTQNSTGSWGLPSFYISTSIVESQDIKIQGPGEIVSSKYRNNNSALKAESQNFLEPVLAKPES